MDQNIAETNRIFPGNFRIFIPQFPAQSSGGFSDDDQMREKRRLFVLIPGIFFKLHIQGFADFADTLKNMVQTFRITHHNATISFFTSRLNASSFKVRLETTSTGLLISSETSSLKSN